MDLYGYSFNFGFGVGYSSSRTVLQQPGPLVLPSLRYKGHDRTLDLSEHDFEGNAFPLQIETRIPLFANEEFALGAQLGVQIGESSLAIFGASGFVELKAGWFSVIPSLGVAYGSFETSTDLNPRNDPEPDPDPSDDEAPESSPADDKDDLALKGLSDPAWLAAVGFKVPLPTSWYLEINHRTKSVPTLGPLLFPQATSWFFGIGHSGFH